MYVSEIRNLCCGDLCAPKTDSDDFLARANSGETTQRKAIAITLTIANSWTRSRA